MADGSPPRSGGIAAELAAAGFTDAVEVGRGGGGVVFRCYQRSLGRSVAIKLLGSDLDEDDRERFLREGYAMGALSGHPNIANILQVGVTETSRPFIVMSFHTMGSLAERVRREGRIAWPDVLRIGVKLCGALETAHRTGTLHRDIKPANVLINDYGEPQLSDFGTARIAGGYKTVTGYFTGTLSYTAPEVLAGNPPTA
ncbi:MAG: serine/threonine-protein kinase, partial [Mycobacterium sp.]